jgi:hypothetical protein
MAGNYHWQRIAKTGLIRRLGDGRRIWHGNLIMGTNSMRQMGKLIESPIQLVSDIIIHETGDWNSDQIQQVFFAPDAEAILAMTWPKNSRGRYLGMGMGTIRYFYCSLSIPGDHG